MPAGLSQQFYMELPSALDDVLVQCTDWIAKRHIGRICRVQTNDGVHRVRFETTAQHRQDNLKSAFLRYFKRPIEPFVLRIPRARDMDAADAAEAAPIAEAEAVHIAEAEPALAPAPAPERHDVDLVKQMEELREQMAQMQAQMQAQLQTPGNVQVINIQINNFGHEAMDHLRAPEVYRRFQTFDGVRHVLNDTYFNPAVPENHNVKSRSVKQNMVEVRVGDGWEVRPFAEIANRMIDIGIGYAYRGFVVTEHNADTQETASIMELMRKTFHPRLRDGIRAALTTRKDREKQVTRVPA